MAAAYWWQHESTERFWVEIRHIPGIGSELRCPLTDINGHRNGWYDLLDAVEPGDTIYHWHARDHRFVGFSYAASSSVTQGEERVVALQGFTPLQEVVDLDSVRLHEHDIRRVCEAIDRSAGDVPTYLPFQRRQDGIRMMSNYFAKLPRELVPIVFGQIPVSVDNTHRAIRVTYLEPFRPKAESEYLAHVVGRVEHRTRQHEQLVNGFAVWLSHQGYDVQRSQAIDLAVAEPLVIVEAKILEDTTFQNQIRQAVGQLYEYRYFQVVDPQASLVFLASRPLESVWRRYLEEDRLVGVAWANGGDYELSSLARRYIGR